MSENSQEPKLKEAVPAEGGNNQEPEEQKSEYQNMDYDLMNKQYENIQKEIEANSPLISDIVPLLLLEEEFSNNPPFLEKIHAVQETHRNYRKIRRDGSCFYRALLFSIMEHIILKKDKKNSL